MWAVPNRPAEGPQRKYRPGWVRPTWPDSVEPQAAWAAGGGYLPNGPYGPLFPESPKEESSTRPTVVNWRPQLLLSHARRQEPPNRRVREVQSLTQMGKKNRWIRATAVNPSRRAPTSYLRSVRCSAGAAAGLQQLAAGRPPPRTTRCALAVASGESERSGQTSGRATAGGDVKRWAPVQVLVWTIS